MVDQTKISLKRYYEAFWSLLGVLAAAPPIILSIILPWLSDSTPAYGFPPMGDVGTFARLGLVSLAFVVTFLVYFWKGGKWLLVAAAVVSFVCLCVYVALYPRFVMRIDVPPPNAAIRVSVGYDRTQFANENFGSKSNEDMLRARGSSDEEIKKLWTYRSLTIARLALFASYCGFIFGFVAVFSLAILFDLRQRLHG
ncbi:MAG TPA: hypothetical protein VII23_07025 [Terriglobales bacterium]